MNGADITVLHFTVTVGSSKTTIIHMGEDCLSCLTCVLSFCLFEQ